MVGFSGGIFYVDVENLQPSDVSGTFSFENLPVSFLSVDDTMDLSTSEMLIIFKHLIKSFIRLDLYRFRLLFYATYCQKNIQLIYIF